MNSIPCSAGVILVALVVLLILGARYIEPYLKHWRDQWWRKAQGKRVVRDWRGGDRP